MKRYDYLLIGAGLSNCVFAYFAISKNKKVLIVDKRNHIGGNCFTEKRFDITIHKYGAHIFHTNDKFVWSFMNEFSEFKPFVNTPIADYNGEYFNLPFNMNTFCQLYGKRLSVEDVAELINKDKIENPSNFEEKCISIVGKIAYDKIIKEYTQKQWNVKNLKDLDPKLIERLPIRLTFNNNYFSDKFQGVPVKGYTSICEQLIKGADVVLNYDYFEHKNALNRVADKIVFSGMIDKLFDYKYGKLPYRSLKFEEEVLKKRNVQGVSVVNYTSNKVPYTRTIEHKHFLNEESDVSVISKEFPISKGEPFYPINNSKTNAIAEKYLEDAKKCEIIALGRLGRYKYLNMDEAVKEAIKTAFSEGL